LFHCFMECHRLLRERSSTKVHHLAKYVHENVVKIRE
jgi:hypothetical protein